MRVGVDAACWHNNRGYGRHARALLRELVRLDASNRYTFVTDTPESFDSLPVGADLRMARASAPAALAASANGHRSLSDMWQMSRALSSADFDVVLFPSIYSYVPVYSRAKKIVFIHDVIAETFPHLTIPNPLGRLLWKAKVSAGRRQAHALVTVSEHSRRGIVNQFRISPEKVFVVGEASDPVFRVVDDIRPNPRLAALGLARDCRLIIYVGGFGPHKNLRMLIDVFARLASPGAFSDARLVMVGEYAKEVFHSEYSALRQLAEVRGVLDRVVFTGFMPDEDLVILLHWATVLVLPSLLEGFGLPAIEAAACGCPVVATTASPLPQLLGNGGLYVDPNDAEGWYQALSHVLTSADSRQRMKTAGLAAAAQLTWTAAAEQLRAILHKVAA